MFLHGVLQNKSETVCVCGKVETDYLSKHITRCMMHLPEFVKDKLCTEGMGRATGHCFQTKPNPKLKLLPGKVVKEHAYHFPLPHFVKARPFQFPNVSRGGPTASNRIRVWEG